VVKRAFRDLPHRARGRTGAEHVGDLAHAPDVRGQIRHGSLDAAAIAPRARTKPLCVKGLIVAVAGRARLALVTGLVCGPSVVFGFGSD
jgi:hypothetical protein